VFAMLRLDKNLVFFDWEDNSSGCGCKILFF